MAKKPESDYRSGSALLKKQLADRAGKPVKMPSKKNLKNAADLAILVGSLVAPVAGGAVRGAKAAKAAKAAIAKKTPYVKVTTGTQAKNANITLKTPGAKKAGSPKPGTKAKIQRVVNPRQGAAGQAAAAGRAADKKAKAVLKPAAGFVTGYQVRKEQEKAKNNKKK
jgi:hypothetical protein